MEADRTGFVFDSKSAVEMASEAMSGFSILTYRDNFGPNI